jgi:hypothetical protein
LLHHRAIDPITTLALDSVSQRQIALLIIQSLHLPGWSGSLPPPAASSRQNTADAFPLSSCPRISATVSDASPPLAAHNLPFEFHLTPPAAHVAFREPLFICSTAHGISFGWSRCKMTKNAKLLSPAISFSAKAPAELQVQLQHDLHEHQRDEQ